MPGFFFVLHNDQNINLTPLKLECNLLSGEINEEKYSIQRYLLNQYADDKLFIDNDDFTILLDGVISNQVELRKQYQSKDWFNCILDLYKTKGDSFFKDFRGSFSGLFLDKILNKFVIFTDHLATKPLYYFKRAGFVCISSELPFLYNFLKINNISYDLDLNAVYMLLSYGFMLGDVTLSAQVKKLFPGNYLLIKNQKVSFHVYYSLPKSFIEKDEINENEVINELDDRFRNAISRQFEKDKIYDYKHLVSLSGGLDSRMTCWVADEMGYKNQLNITFSQSDYLDETVAKQIAADLKHEWIFKSLDNGLYLHEIDAITKITGGNLIYSGPAHSNSILKYIKFNRLGLLHTGQLGDVIVSSYISDTRENLNEIKAAGFYSSKFLNKIEFNYVENHTNQELFLMYERGINGINSGLSIIQQYTETLSPFYDIDFMEYCFSLPIKLRANHYLYKKWILQKYFKAGEYVWEKTKKPVSYQSKVNIIYKGQKIPIERLYGLLKLKLGFSVPVLSTRNHMNPFDYWYNENEELKSNLDNYFHKYMPEILSISDDLYKDLRELYKGTTFEKTQVLSVLSAINLFFSK